MGHQPATTRNPQREKVNHQQHPEEKQQKHDDARGMSTGFVGKFGPKRASTK